MRYLLIVLLFISCKQASEGQKLAATSTGDVFEVVDVTDQYYMDIDTDIIDGRSFDIYLSENNSEIDINFYDGGVLSYRTSSNMNHKVELYGDKVVLTMEFLDGNLFPGYDVCNGGIPDVGTIILESDDTCNYVTGSTVHKYEIVEVGSDIQFVAIDSDMPLDGHVSSNITLL